MARLYADEQFPYPVVEFLRSLGHDVLTAQEAGKANQGIPDPEVLAFATIDDRALLTQNRKDFIQLHRNNSVHIGIIVCTNDRDWQALANRIDTAISEAVCLQGKLIRIVRPGV
ncbi:DUF5615 family PIN-like protein [Leptolyngbya sp. DQ-M1]|uniref:DUF5615 family PIN-like protein n=1 Tax=Leptolyngbya sp. DQ-M1 TaxID=2933920 RepID=UPI003296F2D9